jgi:hypothetical protein
MNKASFFALLLGGLLLMLFGAVTPGLGVQLFGPSNPTGLELGGLMAFVVGFLGLARGSST